MFLVSEALTSTGFIPSCLQMIMAELVLPIPGGPWGGRQPPTQQAWQELNET